VAQLNAPSFKRYVFLLERLTETQVFVLCTELRADDILEKLFRTLFESLNVKHSHKVQQTMLELMSDLIANTETVSEELLEISLAYLLKSSAKSTPAAHLLAQSFFKSNADELQSPVFTFFDSVLGMGKSSDSELADSAYELIETLNSINSGILLTVLPQLELQLQVEDVPKRKQTTELLAAMFSAQGSHLMVEHQALWKAYLGRSKDMDPKIRTVLAEHIGAFFVHHPEASEQITNIATPLVQDNHEGVRVAAVEAIFATASKHPTAVDSTLIDMAINRRLDKKASVREATLTGASTFSHAISQNAEDWAFGTEVPRNVHAADDIARTILRSWHVNDQDTKTLVLNLFNEYVMSSELSSAARATRMLRIWAKCDVHDKTGFQKMIKLQRHSRAMLLRCINIAEADDVEDASALSTAVAVLCRPFPDSARVAEHTTKLLLAKKQTVMNDLRACCEVGIPLGTARSAAKKVIAMIPDSKLAQIDAMKTLLAYCSPFAIDVRTVAELCEQLPSLAAEDDAIGILGVSFLCTFAELASEQFNDVDVLGAVVGLVPEKSALSYQFLQLLPPLATMLRDDHPSIAAKLEKQVAKLAVSGPSDEARLAVDSILSICGAKSSSLSTIAKAHAKRLTVGGDQLSGALGVMISIARGAPQLFAKSYESKVFSFVFAELLTHCEDPATDEPEDAPEWAEVATDEAGAKVLGLQLVVAYLTGRRAMVRDASEFQTLAKDHLNRLFEIVQNIGDTADDPGATPAADCSRIRLAAALSILDLCTFNPLIALISRHQFQQLGMTMQDSCVEVRSQFCDKLAQLMKKNKLPLKFMSFLVLGAADPEKELKTKAAVALQDAVKARRAYIQHAQADENSSMEASSFVVPEYVLPDLVHLLAHHEDFVQEEVDPWIPGQALTEVQEDVIESSKTYINFFLDAVCTKKSKSFDFLLLLIQRMRTMEDRQSVGNSGGMHVMCELAVRMITKRTHALGWTLSKHPGEIKMPTDLVAVPKKGYYDTSQLYLPRADGDASKSFSVFADASSSSRPSSAAGARKTPTTTPKKNTSDASTPKKRKTSGKGSSKQLKKQSAIGSSKQPKKQAVAVATSTPEPARRNSRRAAKDAVSSMLENENSDDDGAVAMESSEGSMDNSTGQAWKPAMRQRPDSAGAAHPMSSTPIVNRRTLVQSDAAASSDSEEEEGDTEVSFRGRPKSAANHQKAPQSATKQMKPVSAEAKAKTKAKTKAAVGKAKPAVASKSTKVVKAKSAVAAKAAPQRRALKKRNSNEAVLSQGSSSDDDSDEAPVRVTRMRSLTSAN
jgi:sister-chromatid-cohesion protein PDS5